MDDRQLFRLSLFISVVGVLLLGGAILLRDVPEVNVDEISLSDRGETVSVTGVSQDVSFNGRHLFFSLRDETGSMRAVFFENSMEEVGFYGADLEEGDRVRIEGKVDVYEGELEVIVKEITRLHSDVQ